MIDRSRGANLTDEDVIAHPAGGQVDDVLHTQSWLTHGGGLCIGSTFGAVRGCTRKSTNTRPCQSADGSAFARVTRAACQGPNASTEEAATDDTLFSMATSGLHECRANKASGKQRFPPGSEGAFHRSPSFPKSSGVQTLFHPFERGEYHRLLVWSSAEIVLADQRDFARSKAYLIPFLAEVILNPHRSRSSAPGMTSCAKSACLRKLRLTHGKMATRARIVPISTIEPLSVTSGGYH
jgi:hypothetical protein